MSTTSAATETSTTKTHHKTRTDKSRTSGYRTVPMRSLADQLHLLQHVLEGMQKHEKDPDYPTALDALGVAAAYDGAVAKALAETSTRMMAKKAVGEAVAERTVIGVILEKIQGTLIAGYGTRSMILLDYGFRPVEKRRKSRKAATTGTPAAPAAGTTAAGKAG